MNVDKLFQDAEERVLAGKNGKVIDLTELFANVDLEGFLEYLMKAKSDGRDYNESLADAYKIYYSELYWMLAADFGSESEMRKSLIESFRGR